MNKILIKATLAATVLLINSCITPFEPKGVADIDNMVVIEGDIILNDTTKVILSRSLSLNSENKVDYITKATVWIQSENGLTYYAKEVLKDSKTTYIIATNGLDPSLRYKLCVVIKGSRTKRYETDFLNVLSSPQIDSIGCKTDFEEKIATFYVNTHDVSDKTRFYKWSYTENWEFSSEFFASIEYIDEKDTVVVIPYEKNHYYCWGSANSTSIIVESTKELAKDIVYHKKLTDISKYDDKISTLYSIEVKQMAITEDAFKYWNNIKKNEDEIGGIFAPQPTEIRGNIRCVTDSTEKAIGYISAGKIAKKRSFFSTRDIGIYKRLSSCETFINRKDSIPYHDLYMSGMNLIGIDEFANESYWAQKRCLDCRVSGTKFKPAFWPNNHI